MTRHAKNRARRDGLSKASVEAIIARPDRWYFGWDGKPNFLGSIEGVPLRVVVALDEPDLIVTIIDRRR